MIAEFYDETNSRIFRLSNRKPLNKYFWEKEKAEIVLKLSRERGYDPLKITVKYL